MATETATAHEAHDVGAFRLSAEDEAALFDGQELETDVTEGGEEGKEPEPKGDGEEPEKKAESKPKPAEAKTPTQDKPKPTEKTEDQRDHRIPIRELLDERERRQAAERRAEDIQRRLAQIEAQREAPKAPDIFSDPEGYQSFTQQTFQEQLATQAINMSLMVAQQSHGEKFDKALAAASELAARGDFSLAARIKDAGMNAGRVLMDWHAQQEVLREVGTDPNAYKTRVQTETKEQLMKDPEFRRQILDELRAEASAGRNGQSPNTVIRLPSANGMTAAARGGNGDDAPATEEDLFAQAGSRRR